MKLTKTKHYRRGKYAARFLLGFMAGILEAIALIVRKCVLFIRKRFRTRRIPITQISPVVASRPPDTSHVEMARKAMVKLGYSQSEAGRRLKFILDHPNPPVDASTLLAAALGVTNAD
ncbi:MAG: hypothetical protein PF795_07015 [Kiritimatiellae bacterium]|jgi:hypothetical protein|nr:hypothetical protein [Kiritimatiellia bacterium]